MASSSPSSVSHSPPSSEKKRGSWVRGGCIGRGSFGSVNIAYDKSNGEVFAVKSVSINAHNSAALRGLENELMVYRSMDSPYIVSWLGDDLTREVSGHVCCNLHLEYMPNGTVADAAKRSMGECDVRSYTRCLTEAVRYLHGVGIVHGDVKGENVLVGHSPGTAKLADFGSARRVSDDVAAVTQGTPLWMAPEVVRGEPKSPESDVWSLGCTVVEMVTGEAPWKRLRGQSAESTLLQIGSGEDVPDVTEKMSEAGRDFVGQCLRRNPEERWSCQQLLDHPFLSEVVSKVDMSPRSVFRWIDSEFGVDDGLQEDDTCPSDLAVNSIDVKLRIAGLAATDAPAVWDEDDDSVWEVVRGESSSPSSDSDVSVERDRSGSGWTGLRSGSSV